MDLNIPLIRVISISKHRNISNKFLANIHKIHRKPKMPFG